MNSYNINKKKGLQSFESLYSLKEDETSKDNTGDDGATAVCGNVRALMRSKTIEKCMENMLKSVFLTKILLVVFFFCYQQLYTPTDA